jgi:hypothetical protein
LQASVCRFFGGSRRSITSASKAPNRLPAAQLHYANSAISAKLNCGSGNGRRPSACFAVVNTE